MNVRAIRRTRWYEADDLEKMFGRKLAQECAPLATVRGRYWGGTLIDYLDELGKRRIRELMDPKTGIDSNARRVHPRRHDTASRGHRRDRYHKDSEP